MTRSSEVVVSAQVVLASATSASVQHGDAITAENVQAYAPSAQAVDLIPKTFREFGFVVDAVVGNSFSVTAPTTLFESVFRTHLHVEGDGVVVAESKPGAASYELPLAALPRWTRPYIDAVTFTPPPDFGPTNFGT